MSEQNQPQNATSTTGGKKSIWDNDLPPGDSPPLPKWPLTVSVIAYSCWMLFLIGMMIVRLKTS
jgi:hypothetical protein